MGRGRKKAGAARNTTAGQGHVKNPGGSGGAPSETGKRWYIGANDVSILGQKVGNLSMGSGAAPGRRTAARDPPDRVVAKNVNLRNREQYIEMDEQIGVINGSTSLEVTRHIIQPGLQDMFAWANQVAKLYERYKFEELCFYTKPSVSGYSTDGQSGNVVLCVDYDSITSSPQTLAEAASFDPHIMGMPYQELCVDTEKSSLTPGKGLFIRQGPVPVGSDPKTYDAGVLYVCVEGTTSGNPIGTLHCRYRLRLINPRLPDSIPAVLHNYVYSVARLDASTADVSGSAVAVPFTTWTTNGLNLGAWSGGQITLTPGLYSVRCVATMVISGGYLLSFQLNQVIGGSSHVEGHERINLFAAAGCQSASFNTDELYLNSADSTFKCNYLSTVSASTALTLRAQIIFQAI